MNGSQGFSRLGWALFTQMAVTLAASYGLAALAAVWPPLNAPAAQWGLGILASYGLGLAAFCLLLPGRTPKGAKAGPPLGPGLFFRCWGAGLGLLYLVNCGTLLLLELVGTLMGRPVLNPVAAAQSAYPAALNLLLGCVIAPLAEELMFRRLLLERLRPYGERFALTASALCFGLFHGNLNQFFYAFALGLLLAAVALYTGRLGYSILLHALLNGVGVGLVPLLSALGSGGTQALAVLVLAAMLLGALLLPALWRRLLPPPGPEGRGPWRELLASPGMAGFCALSAALAFSYLI